MMKRMENKKTMNNTWSNKIIKEMDKSSHSREIDQK
jgi:hypothetical protein